VIRVYDKENVIETTQASGPSSMSAYHANSARSEALLRLLPRIRFRARSRPVTT
jgi:hypothetical protein